MTGLLSGKVWYYQYWIYIWAREAPDKIKKKNKNKYRREFIFRCNGALWTNLKLFGVFGPL